MTQRITIIEDVFDPSSWLVREGADVRDVLTGHFAHWPENGRLYHGHIAHDHDITPLDEIDWNKLPQAPGPFFMVVTPGDPVTAIITVVAVAVTLLATFLLMPSIPALANATVGSSNNELSGRQNKARPLQRIPDILGQVRSTPDLLGQPYKVFEAAKEVEYAYLCVGRGAYEIADIRDDRTPADQIDGMSIAVYGPDTSPLGGSPQLLIGDAITEPLVTVVPITAVNGQTLYAPNYKTVIGNNNIRFWAVTTTDSYLQSTDTSKIKWGDYFEAGDTVIITNASDSNGLGSTVNLAGTYVVDHLDDEHLWLTHPELVNGNWTTLHGWSGSHTGAISPTVVADGVNQWVGPFQTDAENLTQIWANVVAQNGLYGINSDNKQVSISVTVQFELTPIDGNGDPIGSPETFNLTIQGSAVDRSFTGATKKMDPTFTGPCSIRARRTSNFDFSFTGQIQDEVKWRDAMAVEPVDVAGFGNVTTVHSRTPATQVALGLKQRKLNMLATRKVPSRVGDGFGVGLTASRSVADIFCFAALDPFIGGRSLGELAVAQIYAEIAEAQFYFGNAEAVEFGFTFDDDSVSFEETAAAIAEAAFCTARRIGSRLELALEKATSDSVILFNHRNKKPGSETRTISFGNLSDYDGVEYSWVDKGNFDGPAVFRIPEDGSAVRPKKIDSVGQRNLSQVHWHAWREYNKIIYQHVAVEFTTLPEASLVGRLDRILVADNTRSETQDGEVVSQDGLILTLSRSVELDEDVNYRIFLQIPNGTVDAIDIEPGDVSNQVILAQAPSSPLSLDRDRYARTTYWIVAEEDGREQAFLVSEKTQQDNSTFTISAVNYDPRYYSRDGEPVSGIALRDELGRIVRDEGGRVIGI